MLADGSHVQIEGTSFWIDEDYEQQTGRPGYIHGARSIFAEQFSITGRPGAQNLRAQHLKWHLTDFTGEGQLVLRDSDPESVTRFWRSQHLDFRTPGQFTMNYELLQSYPRVTTPSTTTYEGAANFTDHSGTSTTSGTDRRIGNKNGEVRSSTFSPGDVIIRADFYCYLELFEDYATTIEGSSLILRVGKGGVHGTHFRLREGQVWTAKRTVGTHLTTAPHMVRFSVVAPDRQAIFSILDVTDPDKINVVTQVSGVRDTLIDLTFTPKTGRSYRFAVRRPESRSGDDVVRINHIAYGPAPSNNKVRVAVIDSLGGLVEHAEVNVGAEEPGVIIYSLVARLLAGNTYRLSIRRFGGEQAVWVDKAIVTTLSDVNFRHDYIGPGFGGHHSPGYTVWLASTSSTADARVWGYDAVNNEWDDIGTLDDDASTAGATVRAMAHSDRRQYFLLSNNTVYTINPSSVDDRYAYFSTSERTLTGMCVAQNRLFLLAEDSQGARVYSLPLDSASTPIDLATSSLVQFVDVDNAAREQTDTFIYQRMVGTHRGAQFFLNYGWAGTRIFNCDASGSVLSLTELALLDTGMHTTAITHAGGITYIAAYYLAPGPTQAGAPVGQRSVLWAIDANGIPERLGFLRGPVQGSSASADTDRATYLVPYQTDLYIMQYRYVWRYSVGFVGGLYLEYILPEPSFKATMAVTDGRLFIADPGGSTSRVYVGGAVSTYPTGAVVGESLATEQSTGATFESSIYDFGLPGTRKTLTDITVLTALLEATKARVVVEYQIDQDGEWHQIGVTPYGAQHRFTPTDRVQFTAIQLRLTLISLDGVTAPIVRGIVVGAQAAEREEYFDLALLATDQTAAEHIAGEQGEGERKAELLINAFRSGSVLDFVDGYATTDPRRAQSYKVVVEDARVEFSKESEGRIVCTLRVV